MTSHDELHKQIAALEGILATMPEDAPHREGLLATLASLRAQLGQSSQPGGNDFSQAQIKHINEVYGRNRVEGDEVHGDKHVHYGADTLDPAVLLREYLGSLSTTCNQLSLTDADSSDPTHAAVELAAVYVQLEVAGTSLPAEEGENPRRPRRARRPDADRPPLTAAQALAATPRMVLLGDPGSGKTTFGNFLTFCLAKIAQDVTEWRRYLGDDWPQTPLVPIRIVLRDFAAWLGGLETLPGEADQQVLWDWMVTKYQEPLVNLLREHVADGEALLFFDGLDEVPVGDDGRLLRLVTGTIRAFAESRSRLLVTCRVLDYEEPHRKLPFLPHDTLLPLSQQLRFTFIENWFATLAKLERKLQNDPASLRDALKLAITEREELHRLAGNPLLLTMMTLLHAYEGTLPEERVNLYALCVDWLLNKWRPAPGEQALPALLGIADWSKSDLNRLMDRLGYTAHARGVGSDGEQGADLPRKLLIDTASEFFAAYDRERDIERGQIVCRYISRYSSGLLQQYSDGIYRFPHRTFQEYLAARRLVSDEDWPDAEAEFVPRTLLRLDEGGQWREALLLAVSQQVVVGNQVTPAALLVEELLDRFQADPLAQTEDLLLAGDVLLEVGRDRLKRLGTRRAKLWDETVAHLLALLTTLTATGAARYPVTARSRAGLLLGCLGDPRLGVTDLAIDWCDVPAGPFLLGSTDADKLAQKDEKPQRTVNLPGFRISRYAVTNAQWQQFMDDGGYQERRWWSEAGWASKEQRNWTKPDYWDDPRFNGANQPVVGISWYEATAFCRWLSAKLGYAVRLPSEAEWEKAARGNDGRIYPWGNKWDEAKANTDESNIGATTTVGCYPDGASPCGALDMAGNTFDWTATPWRDSYQNHDGTERQEDDGRSFVRRGGAWSFARLRARCASRYYFRPSGRGFYLGARVVAALTNQ